MQISLLTLDTCYHLGSLDPDDRGEQGESHEGHLLSVSTCPLAWRSIARLGGRKLHGINKADGSTIRFVDVLAASKNGDFAD